MQSDRRLRDYIGELPHPTLFASVVGAHLFGFASPGSDYDIRGCHVLPLRDVIGLEEPEESVERRDTRDGLEFDLVTHDVRKYCRMILNSNGNTLDQLFSPIVVVTTKWHEVLKEIAAKCLNRGHAKHFRTQARNQWDDFTREKTLRVRPLLYSYRSLLTGIHLMKTGEVQSNLVELNRVYRLSVIDELLAIKLQKEGTATISPQQLGPHHLEQERLIKELDREAERSRLPKEIACRPEVNDFLVQVRQEIFPRNCD